MVRASTLGLSLAAFFFSNLAVRAADIPKSRPIELSVDATEAPRKLLRARLVIPAAPGPLTLYYPKWIPGEHSPSGPINDLSGLRLHAAGKPLTWRRDDVDLYAFHLVVPEGADAVEATLDYLASGAKDGYTSGASMTPQLAVLSWNQVLLYPKGKPVRDQPVHASVKLPRDWKFGTALPVEPSRDGIVQFKTVSLETLVDSPVLCGANLKEVPLDSGAGPRHFLVIAADHPHSLEMSAALKGHYERLVAEADALFGSHHYRSYHFLLTLSDYIKPDGIEHHECSDNRLPERYLLDDSYRKQWAAWLLPHEFVHSWNGKFRRPEGLATPDFQQPMKTRLLWVYEGLTEYLGFVLAGRSGLYTPALSRENFAIIADWARNQHGRTWRPLEDTTTAAPFLYSPLARNEWGSRRRGVDFYDEGALIWLDVDTLIREKTGGKKSLDDFCHAFFGGKENVPEVKPYTVDDVAKALNDVVVHDWKGFLEKRVTAIAAEPPLDGLRRSGWNVVMSETAGDIFKSRDGEDNTINLTCSIGLLLKDHGQVVDVIPGKAADKAGIGPGMKLIGINNRRWTSDRLHEALAATKGGKEKLVFLMEDQDYFKTFPLDYAEGEKYPELKRDEAKPDMFSEIFQPHAAK